MALHGELIDMLHRDGVAAAAEKRRHLKELEQSLTGAKAPPRPLRDVFARYREAEADAAATALSATPAAHRASARS